MKLMFKISILTVLFIFAFNTHAQIPGSSVDGLNIKTSSENPRPGQSVTITVESFSFDLNSASIVWLVDGKTHDQGVGLKNISVTSPKIGVSMTVTAVVKTSDGREVRKSLTIKTGYVDIIWESDGYKPPFFDGKFPFTYQNSVRFIAIPHLSKDGRTEIDPKSLIYSWKSDGKYITDGQGQGKNYVDIQSGNIPKPFQISVEVYSREGTERTIGNIILNPGEPSLSFYEESSLYGILFNKSLTGRVPLINSEMEVLAVPYGFNIDEDNSYTWSVNNIEQPNLLKSKSITIRTKPDTEGSSSINLDIRNRSSILQGARGGFSVYFSKRSQEKVGQDDIIF